MTFTAVFIGDTANVKYKLKRQKHQHQPKLKYLQKMLDLNKKTTSSLHITIVIKTQIKSPPTK